MIQACDVSSDDINPLGKGDRLEKIGLFFLEIK